ncbi:MAG: sigma-70 family RNA polymerase sigma factor [Acidobacteriaceae bacterium]
MHNSFDQIPIAELLSRCVTPGEIGAWEEFVRRFHRLIAKVVLRTLGRLGEPASHLVDDLVQETYLKLCADDFRLLREFVQQHPDAFFGYIKVVAANVVRDHFKSLRAHKRGSQVLHVDSDSTTAPTRESDAGSPAFMERSILVREIARQLDICVAGPDSERKAMIFWLYYRLGLSAAAIAALPEVGLGEKGVESTIIRITRALRQRMASPVPAARVVKAGSRKEGIMSTESL